MSIEYKGKTIKAKKKSGLLTLNLSSNQIKDITEIKGLENLVNLQVLYLANNQISEIKGLENLHNLQKLDIANNQITEIKGLDNLSNLSSLFLGNNQISRIVGLDQLSNLKSLKLNKNQIAEIQGLESLVNLHNLDLSYNQIKEFKGFENLNNLKLLYIYNNPAYEELRHVFGSLGPREVLEYCKKPVEERDKIKRMGPPQLPRKAGTQYCDICQRYVAPKSKYNATFWVLLIVFCCCCCIAIIPLIIIYAVSNRKCPICNSKLTGVIPPTFQQPISALPTTQPPISQVNIQKNGFNFCPNCGEQVVGNFCPMCGSKTDSQ